MAESSISSKGQITIPKPVRDHLNLHPGSAVEFVITPGGEVVIRKRYDSARPLRGLLGHLAKAQPLTTEQLDEALDREVARADAAVITASERGTEAGHSAEKSEGQND